MKNVSGRKSLPIIDAAYGLALEINQAVVKFPRHQRPGLGRRMEEAAFELLASLVKARYLRPRIRPRQRFSFRLPKPWIPCGSWSGCQKTWSVSRSSTTRSWPGLMREVGRMLSGCWDIRR